MGTRPLMLPPDSSDPDSLGVWTLWIGSLDSSSRWDASFEGWA